MWKLSLLIKNKIKINYLDSQLTNCKNSFDSKK